MLKDLRKRSGLTQAQLSKKMGYTSPQFISNIERGLARLPAAKFKAASKIFGVSVKELISMRLKADKARMMKRYGGLK